jgi:hypothetical protein
MQSNLPHRAKLLRKEFDARFFNNESYDGDKPSLIKLIDVYNLFKRDYRA